MPMKNPQKNQESERDHEDAANGKEMKSANAKEEGESRSFPVYVTQTDALLEAPPGSIDWHADRCKFAKKRASSVWVGSPPTTMTRERERERDRERGVWVDERRQACCDGRWLA